MMCALYGVARAGIYVWQLRLPSQRAQTDQAIIAAIRRVHSQNRKLYGSPVIHRQPQLERLAVGRRRIARLMREY